MRRRRFTFNILTVAILNQLTKSLPIRIISFSSNSRLFVPFIVNYQKRHDRRSGIRVDFNERFSEQIDDTVAENEFYLRILIKKVLALDPKYL